MSTITDITATHTFTATALDAELGRRKNNKGREVKARAKSYVLPALSTDAIARIKAGDVVTVTFRSGRTVIVGLKG